MSEPNALAITRRRSPPAFPLRLAGPLNLDAVDHVRGVLATVAGTERYVLLQCDGLTAIEPAAAACLWALCRDAEHEGRQRVRLRNLSPTLTRRLRLHPLTAYLLADDELFADPFDGGRSSER